MPHDLGPVQTDFRERPWGLLVLSMLGVAGVMFALAGDADRFVDHYLATLGQAETPVDVPRGPCLRGAKR